MSKLRKSWREAAQAQGNYLALVVLAFAFLFFALYFASNGRIAAFVAQKVGELSNAFK
jgi:hypothetical protein